MTSELPTIVVIDDDLPDASAIAGDLGEQRADVLPRTPDNIEAEELESAQLVVVDYRLDKWQERDTLGNPGLKPMNGLALIEVLRSHLLAKRVERGDTPPGFVLYSGDDDAFPEARLRTENVTSIWSRD